MIMLIMLKASIRASLRVKRRPVAITLGRPKVVVIAKTLPTRLKTLTKVILVPVVVGQLANITSPTKATRRQPTTKPRPKRLGQRPILKACPVALEKPIKHIEGPVTPKP